MNHQRQKTIWFVVRQDYVQTRRVGERKEMGKSKKGNKDEGRKWWLTGMKGGRRLRVMKVLKTMQERLEGACRGDVNHPCADPLMESGVSIAATTMTKGSGGEERDYLAYTSTWLFIWRRSGQKFKQDSNSSGAEPWRRGWYRCSLACSWLVLPALL